MLRMILSIVIITQAFGIGYICGHNKGFDVGHDIGLLDAKYHFVHTFIAPSCHLNGRDG